MSDSIRGLAQYGAGVPGVAAANAPRDYIDIQAPANAFGAINARTQQQFGAETQQGSGQLEQAAQTIQARQNQTATDEAYNNYSNTTMNIMYGDPNAAPGTPERGGLISMRGADALNAGPGMLKKLSDARAQISGGLQNAAQRLQFDEQSRRLLTATQEQVGRHLDAQQQAWQDTTAKATLDTQMRSAALTYNDPEHIMHTLADANAQGIRAFRSAHGGDGTDPAALQAGQDQQGMIIHAAIEGAAAHGDWGAAQTLFDRFGAVLAPNVAASIGQELHAKAKKAGDDAYLDNLLNGYGGTNTGLNGAPRPNTASHVSGDLVVANQPSGQTIEPEAVDRAKQIINGLTQRGLDQATATAFAANALHESAANPNTGPGDKGASHGLFQWRDDRAASLQKFAGGVDNVPLDKQLDFVMQELHGSHAGAWASIQSAQGVAAKAAAISKYFEAPNDVNGEQARRSATALQLAQQIGLPGASQTAPATGGATAPAAGGYQGAQPQPATGGAQVQQVAATGEQPQAQPIPTTTTTVQQKAPADLYPDESALTMQILRDTQGDPERRADLLSGMRQRMSVISMVTATDRKNLDNSLKNIEPALADGKDGVVIPEATIRHLLPPAQAAEVMENLTTAQQAGQAFKAVQWGTNADIMAARQRLTAGMGPGSTQVKKGGEGGIGEEQPGAEVGTEAYRIRQKVLAKFDEKVAARDAALKADPVAFVSTAPTVAAALKAVQDPSLTDDQKAAAGDRYFSSILAAQTHLGIPDDQQHLFTVDQATRMAGQINSADPSQTDVGKQLDKMSTEYGDHWGKVFDDMVSLGKLNDQYQTLAMIGDKNVRGDFQRMLSAAQEKGGTSKLKEAAGPEAIKDINQNIETYLTDFKKTVNVPGIAANTDVIARMRTSIANLAMFYTLQGTPGATAVQNAAAGILGRYDFDGTKRIPKGTGALVDSATSNAISGLKAEDILAPPLAADIRNPIAPRAEHATQDEATMQKQRQEDVLAAVQKKAIWVNNESDNGLVLFTQARDGGMFAVRRADGTRVEVPFADLKKLSVAPPEPGSVGGVGPSDATILGATF
jgi:hypothetical protein